MRDTETSITFHIDKKLLSEFEEATKKKSEELGFPLNRKQSMQLAIKEAIEKWTNKKPGE